MSDYISERSLISILKHLPVITLLQFRTVCKRWKQLIDSPGFVADHLSVRSPKFLLQNGRRRRFFVVDLLHRPRVKPLNKPLPRENFYLCGTLHGIVCLYNVFKFFLWNPALRKVSTIDRPMSINVLDIFIGYGQRQLQLTYGFWISPSTKEFKIIFILQTKTAVICHLYSSLQGEWKIIPTPTEVENWTSCKEGPPVMIGDVAHWGGCLDEIFGIGIFHWDHHLHRDKAILSFDFVQECFETIELCDPREFSKPDETHFPSCCIMGSDDYHAAPFRWKDKLAFVSWSIEPPYQCKIFLRNENSWVGMFHFLGWDTFHHVFWAMEVLEEVKKGGKGKRKRDCDFVGAQDTVRVLATTATDRKNSIGALVLNGNRGSCKNVKTGLDPYFDVIMAHDFVESLLFP